MSLDLIKMANIENKNIKKLKSSETPIHLEQLQTIVNRLAKKEEANTKNIKPAPSTMFNDSEFIKQEHSICSSQITKSILLLLGSKKLESISLTHMHLEIYLLEKVLPKLATELNYSNFKSYSNIINNKMTDLLENNLVIKQKNKFELTTKGKQTHNNIKEDTTLKEIKLVNNFKELLNDLSVDELWALTYFSHPELDIEPIRRKKIIKDRKKLAFSMYYKEKLSVSKAAHIAGEYLGDFIKQIKSAPQK